MNKYRVSIIMGIYNCANTLREAVDSILNQTYQEWKLIMCDDGSSDETYAIALEYQKLYPDKIVAIKNPKNMGLNYTLNHCIEEVDTDYIARMDGDDVSASTRLEKEVRYLDEHQEYAIVSCPMIMFDESGEWGLTNVIEFPQVNDFCNHSPFFCHAASVIRTDAMRAVGGYTVDKKFLRVEDCNLWFKMYAQGYRGANLKEPLYKMRDDRNATHRRSFRARLNGCYVMYDGFRQVHMPVYKYGYVLKNAAIELTKCLIPDSLYGFVHKKRYVRR